jgi:hypothetical protein
MPDPEQLARQEIDALLRPCGWVVQDRNAVNLSVACGVAVRELTFKGGEPDYTLFVDSKAAGSEKTYRERVARLQPQGGDILYSREGGILEIACQIPSNVMLCMGQRMMLIRTARGIAARLIMHWLNSSFILSRVKKLSTGSASPHLNVGEVQIFDMPIPPAAEQQRIFAEVERCLSVVEELEAAVNANQRATRFRQSILDKTFMGEPSSSDQLTD